MLYEYSPKNGETFVFSNKWQGDKKRIKIDTNFLEITQDDNSGIFLVTIENEDDGKITKVISNVELDLQNLETENFFNLVLKR